MKRGSEDYGERRQSHSEMTNNVGLMSGWYNSTFRGAQKQPNPVGVQPNTQSDKKRGVME